MGRWASLDVPACETLYVASVSGEPGHESARHFGGQGRRRFRHRARATLADAVAELVERRVGALLVFGEDDPEQRHPLGIVTERDILYYCAG